MSFGGPPISTETAEEADEILRNNQKESDIEAVVLSAPPKLVYSKLILRFTRKLLVAVAEKWDSNVLAIGKIAPSNWKPSSHPVLTVSVSCPYAILLLVQPPSHPGLTVSVSCPYAVLLLVQPLFHPGLTV